MSRGGLSTADFVKCISVQEVTRVGLKRLAPVVKQFAKAEGLLGARARRRGARMKSAIPVRKAVARMRPYHPPLEGRDGKLRLDFNENTIGCSPKVLEAIRNLSSDAVSMYPEQETVRRELADFFGVNNDELLLTNGTDEALHLIVDTFVEPRRRRLARRTHLRDVPLLFGTCRRAHSGVALRRAIAISDERAARCAAQTAPRSFFSPIQIIPPAACCDPRNCGASCKPPRTLSWLWMKRISSIRESRFFRGFDVTTI